MGFLDRGILWQVKPHLTSQQQRMAFIIADEFRKAGLPANVAAAAIANAWHESRLNPLAAGDNGQSIGLFQLYSKGAGHGMTIEDRKDPIINTKRIIEVVKKRWDKFEPHVGSVIGSTKVFTIYVEIPKNKEQKAEERAQTASKFFPTDSVSYVEPLAFVALFVGMALGTTSLLWYINKD